VIFMDILTSRGGWLCGDGGPEMSALDPCLTRSRGPSGEPERTRPTPLLRQQRLRLPRGVQHRRRRL